VQNYKWEREVKNRADWEKYIKEARVRIGLQCHLLRRRFIYKLGITINVVICIPP
jgi:hypothetical protein